VRWKIKMFKISPQREVVPGNSRIFTFPNDGTIPLLLFPWRKRKKGSPVQVIFQADRWED